MKEWIVGILIVVLFASSFVYFQQFVSARYGVADDVQIGSHYNVYNETSSIVLDSNDALMNKTITEGDAWQSTISGAWRTIRNIPRIVPIVYKLLAQASLDLHLPAFVLPIIVTMVLTIIIFWIIAWISGLVRPNVKYDIS